MKAASATFRRSSPTCGMLLITTREIAFSYRVIMNFKIVRTRTKRGRGGWNVSRTWIYANVCAIVASDSVSLWRNTPLDITDFGNGIIPNTNRFSTLSDPNIDVEYQTSTNGSVYNEGNFAFFAVNVLFVGINQVGGGTLGDESSRVNGNFIWVQYNMAKYLPRGMRAIVIFAQAPMNGSRQQHFGTPFTNLLRTSAYARIKAMYIHGDGHAYATYSPDPNNRNLTSLQVDGGELANPLLVSFMSDAVSGSISYTINRRGGRYGGTCPAGNTDKTWSSTY